MDPISAAGIGLSVASLAMQVFAGAIKGYELFLEMSEMPSQYQHLQICLKIEQTRLLNWGEKIGLVEEQLEKPSHALQLNSNLIIGILMEIQATFRSIVKITANYEKAVPVLPREDPNRPDQSAQTSRLRRTLNYLNRPTSVGARLKWAMVEHDKFEGALKKLIAFNDRIEAFLDRSALDELRLSQEKSNLLLLQLTDQVGQLQTLVAAVKFGGGRHEAVASPFLSRSSTIVESTESDLFTTLVTFKLEQSSSIDQNQKLLLDDNDIELSPNSISQRRSQMNWGGRMVWIEWRDIIPDLPSMPELERVLEDRVSKLTSILMSEKKPPAFRSPSCLGYVRYQDEDDGVRYGLVYDSASYTDEADATLVSLRELLDTRARPSLSQRMALACQIAESLMYLHAVNWLHKGMRSESILFCGPASHSSHDMSLQNPIMSGFDFSRPDLSKEVTVKAPSNPEHDLYRHPDLIEYSHLRSQKSHDIYSLGIVLLEIAFWMPIEELVGVPIGKKGARSLIPGIRGKLLEDTFGQHDSISSALASYMGDAYSEAVLRCIEGGQAIGVEKSVDEADPMVGRKIQEVFYEEILLKLQKAKI